MNLSLFMSIDLVSFEFGMNLGMNSSTDLGMVLSMDLCMKLGMNVGMVLCKVLENLVQVFDECELCTMLEASIGCIISEVGRL